MSAEAKKEKSVFGELHKGLFEHSWEMWVGSIILAILSICLFMIWKPWGSSGGILNWGQNIFGMFLPLTESAPAPNGVWIWYENPYAMLSIMVIMGALASALLAKEFAVRLAPAGELFKGLLGGLLMGIGCIIGMGCTIGNFFSGWAALSAGAIIFVIGLVIGVFFAVRYLLWEMEKHPKMSSGKSSTFLQAKTKGNSLQPLAGVIVIIIALAIPFLFYSADGMYAEKYFEGIGWMPTITGTTLIGFIFIGLLIGVVLQRSRWCVVRALREPFMTGDAKPAVAIIAGLLVGILGFTVIKIMSIGSEMDGVSVYMTVFGNFWMPAIIGGIIFGFGMTIAGGCTIGSSWRAGEGHVKLWLALVGIIIAAPLTAEYLQPAFMNILPAWMKQKIFLPDYFAYIGSVIIMPVSYTHLRAHET